MQIPLDFIQGLESQSNVTDLTLVELEQRAIPFSRSTEHGSRAFYCNVRNRSGGVTLVLGSERVRQKKLNDRQKAIHADLTKTLQQVQDYLQHAPVVHIKRTIGDNASFTPHCDLYLTVQRPDNTRQAYLWAKTLTESQWDTPGPHLTLICIPEWPESDRQILAFPEQNTTFVLGSDYVGEVKMGFLRMAMWQAKEAGMLSLHAGSKVLKTRNKKGELKRYGMLLFGLSGTGKTTHSCHHHGLDSSGEGVEILQDDIVFLRNDGSALGTERGFYLKTEGIQVNTQPLVHQAVTSQGALFENVMVDANGHLDFNHLTLTSNGRAVIPRKTMHPYTAENINLPSLNELDGLIVAFITRRMTVLPLISKLNLEQAAATFMLGESIETSAGDPRRAGESVRVVGTNPFITGDEAAEGNWFYDFLLANADKVRCYLLNTGGIGEILEKNDSGPATIKQKVLRVGIDEMTSLIRGIARDSIEWEEEPYFGTSVPKSADGVDLDKFRPERFYTPEQIRTYVQRLRQERRDWLANFTNLNPNVTAAM